MVEPRLLYSELKAHDIGLFAGVPDSLLGSFCAYVDDHCGAGEHIITANEGNAIALAAGHYMASGKISVVYMQNSGLGNAINPLTSLVDPEVYRIPLLMIIGWRGEPGVKDEPQHVKQGRITQGQLGLLETPCWLLDADCDVKTLLAEVFAKLECTQAPVALLVRKDAFSPYKSQRKSMRSYKLEREAAIGQVIRLSDPGDLVVATTGKASREVFEFRASSDDSQRDFLTVGGMGHTASIALGVALGQPDRRVLCLDGDGSVLMHMGALAIIGSVKPRRFVHVLLNNAAHESVGGQATVADAVDFAAVAKATGYAAYFQANDEASLNQCWEQLTPIVGPVMLEIKIKAGARSDLGRPTSTPEQNKQAFMAHARG